MNNNSDIIKITLLKNIRIKNTHNGVLFPEQNAIKVEFRNGDCRYLDLFSNHDFTDLYFELVTTKKTKEKILFMEDLDNE